MQAAFLLVVIFISIYQNYVVDADGPQIKNPSLTTAEVIKQEGYHGEVHTVVTKDGYILTLDRIYANKKGVPGKQPVLLQHGVLDTSNTWVNNIQTSLGLTPDEIQPLANLNGTPGIESRVCVILDNRFRKIFAIALRISTPTTFLLSDENYDVWLGNSRGNPYSSAHLKYFPSSPQYWNFSFHEMGVYDLPACINYILKVTNVSDDIFYVGHSQGSGLFYVYASMFPEEAAKNIKVAFTLAPAVFLGKADPFIRSAVLFLANNKWMFDLLGVTHLSILDTYQFLAYHCDDSPLATYVCRTIIYTFYGYDGTEMAANELPQFYGHQGASVSIKDGIHFGQLFRTDEFQRYDYGPEKNLEAYGVRKTPTYDLAKVKVPTYVYCGTNDKLVSPKDAKKLVKILPNNKYFQVIKNYNHVDFIYAKNAKELVYNNILEVFKKYQ